MALATVYQHEKKGGKRGDAGLGGVGTQHRSCAEAEVKADAGSGACSEQPSDRHHEPRVWVGEEDAGR